MATISVHRLSKTFGRRHPAVQALDFEAADEKMTFLLGPSGAGKTTTLRMVAGLAEPNEGRIHIGGRDVSRLAPRDRNLAMVYDKHSLYPHLSVFENLAYPLRIRKQSAAEIKRRIDDVAAVLEIGHLLDRQPNQLSGGQMQRVAIGRALVRDADAFLLDEPISHLDAKLRAHMRVEFKKLQRDFRATILYVSHDQLEALTMADQIVVMDKGVRQQIGTPTDIYFRPANAFVASFVGEPGMNLIPCRLRGEDGRTRLYGEGFDLAFDDTGAVGLGPDDDLLLGVRPQDIEIVAGPAAEGGNVVEGPLYAAEALGSERIIDVQLGSAILRVRGPIARTAFISGAIGTPVRCRIDPERIYLFDRETGRTVAQARFARDERH